MTNNDVLRRIRYTFDLADDQVVSIFALADHQVSREETCDWMKKDEDPAFKTLEDEMLATFLNGLIILKRGKKDGPQPIPEKKLNNNIIFRKLKIALNLSADDTIGILDLAEHRLGKSELSAFFRKPGHRHYRDCKDQILRAFLKGMRLKYRPTN